MNFKEVVQKLFDSQEYKQFHENYPDYYLAHGFMQLNKEFVQEKEWQIGLYSKEKDNLAVFETNPIKQLPFEEAFKDGGTISHLKDVESFKETNNILETVKEVMQEKHSHEIANSYIIILQVLDENPVYNITVITAAFAMITIRIHAKTGEILDEAKRSILDLKKE